MTVSYVRWRDACWSAERDEVSKIGLAELHEVGFVLAETEESLTLGLEHPGDTPGVRFWLCIPKVNILERRDMEIEAAFPKCKKRKKA